MKRIASPNGQLYSGGMTPHEPLVPVTRRKDGTLTDLELYKDGGLTCRTYIQQTTELRKFGVHILLGYAVGIGLFMAKETTSNPAYIKQAFLIGGGALMMFGFALWTVNWHFTEGFRAVRDEFLVPMENSYATVMKAEDSARAPPSDGCPLGPWTAHKNRRSKSSGVRQWCALHGTFMAVIGLGAFSIIFGLWG